ncbi:MAG: hypothetical protein A2015_06655 [Spirochaetes bacterium GWF1_31_7]|nr:MAG: hypothetical protein A2Y30_09805 [Spirochaetes bacterium GWE1_32_154]OHD46519.1 MAG: hypothetical protein A2015_06655 [Spirochaetes bacterium GWF1_31_7]OHD49328.1 MAG: hypothetical protein A2Y29_03650 [Spirochaetes bacterium GWE2_31_10]HBD96437.1 hypothetical protein [Spirochaetia bacterium]HBI36816.1 hypothetical protein [Spirochaetia bacterium]
MSAIKGLIYRSRRGLLTLFFVIISFILIIFSDTRGLISFSKIGLSIIYPFQFMINSLGDKFNDMVNAVSQIKQIEDEVKGLRDELDLYRKMMVDFNVIIKENSDLRNTLDLKDNLDYKTVAAQIVGRDPNNFFDYLIIDKGSNAGIIENMPVISYKKGRKALIGRVSLVTPFSSKVITLNNPEMNVGVVVGNENTHCVVQGDNSSLDYAKLLYLPKDYDFPGSKSSLVYTSGDSIFYPKGIEIGVMTEVLPSKKYEIYNEAVIKLTENYNKIEFVLVLIVNFKKDDFNLLENPF